MWSVILPLALGAAISPTLLAAVVILLSGKEHPLKKSFLYLFGALVPLIVVTILVHSFARNLVDFGYSIKAYSESIDIGIALLLICIGSFIWLRRRQGKNFIPKQSTKVPVKTTHALHSFLLGAIMMSWDFSTFALFIPAEKDIFFWHQSVETQIVAVVFLIFMTLLPVSVPIGLYLVMPNKVVEVLVPFSNWTKKNSAAIAIALCYGFAAFLLWKGISGMHF